MRFLHLVASARAKASRSSSDGFRCALWRSHPALATMTEVLPLPAAAITRLCCSSITTALRCSSVSGRASIVSSSLRERISSLAMYVSLAFVRASSGGFQETPGYPEASGSPEHPPGPSASAP